MNDLMLRKHANELRDTWQGRVLEHSTGQMARVVQSVLAHCFPDSVEILFKVIYPGFKSITLPFYCSAGKIAAGGEIVADLADKQGRIVKNTMVFKSEGDLQDAFRRLADELKLIDSERVELFKAVHHWIVADTRFAPDSPELVERLNR